MSSEANLGAAAAPALPAHETAPAPLRRERHANGVVHYRSGLLSNAGFAHAFSTRHGGVSAAPFDTMNLGIAQAPGEPDTEANIARNAALLLAASGAPSAHMIRVKQVHGAAVHWCAEAARFGPPTVEADVVASAHLGVAPCVRTADCVPILIACPLTGAVAAVHAGWRGIVAGVVRAAVDALAQAGAEPCGLLAAIGPCIGRSAYEVGPEVAAEFVRAGLGGCVVRSARWPRPHLDCFGAVRAQLMSCGLSRTSVDGQELCTATVTSDCGREFFSYRRDGARSGRMAAVIVPRGPSASY